MRDGHENNRSQRGGRQRVEKAAAEDSKFRENPAAEVRADQTQNNVRYASEAAAPRKFSREPAGNHRERIDQPASHQQEHTCAEGCIVVPTGSCSRWAVAAIPRSRAHRHITRDRAVEAVASRRSAAALEGVRIGNGQLISFGSRRTDIRDELPG